MSGRFGRRTAALRVRHWRGLVAIGLMVCLGLCWGIGQAAAQAATPDMTRLIKRLKPLVPYRTPNVPAAQSFVAGGQWHALKNAAPFGAGTPLLLTDGRVLVHESCASHWWLLRPDSKGSYVNGTWSRAGSLPSGYAPLYFSSAVLADGRVIVNGGEYNNSGAGCADAFTTKGAIYNPSTNKWTAVKPPSGWKKIGDAQNVVLPNGTFLLANCCTNQIVKLNPSTLTWSAVGTTGKVDINDEEGWTLLRDGSVLTIDAFTKSTTSSHAERYYNGAWHDAGNLTKLNDSLGSKPSYELGPAVLMTNGKVFATGATGKNAVYTPPSTLTGTGSWAAGPSFPVINGKRDDIADGPAALLPNGHVLMMSSPGIFQTPSHFFEFNGSSLMRVSEPPNAPNDSSYVGRMLVLPTGQVLLTDGSNDVEIYTPTGSPATTLRPTIVSFPTSVRVGQTYTLTGRHLNGWSQASVYGDDSSSATNYPLVRITHTNTSTNVTTVLYARTYGHSSMGVAVAANVTTKVKLPSNLPVGASRLEVVVNGIASAKYSITVGPSAEVASREMDIQ